MEGRPVDRGAVRLAAMRTLLRILSEPNPVETELPSDAFCTMLLDGHGEVALAAVNEMGLDEVRAILVRLAR